MNMILTCLFLLFIFFPHLTLAENKSVIKICATGSIQKSVPSYGQAFINGIKLGINSHKNGSDIDYQIQEYFYEVNSLEVIDTTQKMIKEKCTVIIGFDTTSELLLVQNEIDKNKQMVIAIFAHLNNQLKQTDNIISLQPPAEFLIHHLAEYLEKKGMIDKIRYPLIVTAIDQESLNLYRESYLSFFKTKNIATNTLDVVDNTFNVESFIKEFYHSKKKYDSLVLLTRMTIGVSIMDKVSEISSQKGSSLLVLGTEHFGSAQMPFFLTHLKHKNVNIFFARHNITEDSDPNYQKYYKQYHTIYKTEPMVISGYGYDASVFIIEASKYLDIKNSSKRIISSQELLEAAKHAAFKGVTGLQIKEGLSCSYQKSFVTHLTTKGYQTVDGRL